MAKGSSGILGDDTEVDEGDDYFETSKTPEVLAADGIDVIVHAHCGGRTWQDYGPAEYRGASVVRPAHHR